MYKKELKDKAKTKISIDRELANKLKSRTRVGETYSNVISKLLKNANHD